MSGGGPPWSWNLITDLRFMWQYEFMRNAFEAGTMIALVAGLVGYFVVLRRSAFASHALGHTGFSGAAAAVLVGVDPVYGLLVFTMVTASGMALLGNRASNRDVEIGTVLAFALGLGLLFLSLYQGYATEAYSILFGEVLGISTSGVDFTFWTGLIVIAIVAMVYRPLLFSSLDEDVAEAKGMPMLFLNLVFLLLLAVTISIAVQIIGVLLIFALMVTPAAIAVRLTKRAASAATVSIVVAMTAVWAGLFIGFYEPYPVSFFIVGIVFVEYICIRGMGVLRETSYLQAVDATESQGVQSLRNASLTAAVAQALFVAGALFLTASLLAHPSAAWNPSGLYRHALVAIAFLVPAAIVGAVSFLLYFSGFRKMASSSRDFLSPAFLTLVGILGITMTVGGLGLFLGGVALNASAYALAPVAILFGVPLLLLGILLSVVGLFGQAVGNWRVGVRYEENALRTGAFLTCIPLVGFAVSYFGYRRALARGSPPSVVPIPA
ncbi:MAG: metal ABC transporter permease [Thermoplasmata archaeon]